MTERKHKKADEIRQQIRELEYIKEQFAKERIINFIIKPVEFLRNDLIDVVERNITKLKSEYERL